MHSKTSLTTNDARKADCEKNILQYYNVWKLFCLEVWNVEQLKIYVRKIS